MPPFVFIWNNVVKWMNISRYGWIAFCLDKRLDFNRFTDLRKLLNNYWYSLLLLVWWFLSTSIIPGDSQCHYMGLSRRYSGTHAQTSTHTGAHYHSSLLWDLLHGEQAALSHRFRWEYRSIDVLMAAVCVVQRSHNISIYYLVNSILTHSETVLQWLPQ